MPFDTFFKLINNTYWDVRDPSNPNQCFDLAVGWCVAMGMPNTIFSGLLNAYQIFENPTQAMKDNFNFIANTPNGVPIKGDIVVFKASYNGGAGHVGVATGVGDVNTVELFEQNDPTGSNCHTRVYNYNHISGWLRSKVAPLPANDKRPYWFDLMSKVVWNVGWESLSDANITKFTSEYPGQLKRSGMWDELCKKAGITGDTNAVNPNILYSTIQNLVSIAGARKQAFVDAVTAIQKLT